MANRYNHTTSNSELVSAFSERIKGSTVLVTGVTPPGLGYRFLKEIAVADPATLIFAGRKASKFQAAMDEVRAAKPAITVKYIEIDLASFKSVRAAAEVVNGWEDVPHIDVLVNNAGIMATPFRLTEDGVEDHFQSNHLGHFLFTNLIMDKLLASSRPRIVSVSSNGTRFGGIRWTDINFGNGRNYKVWDAYGQSKTANNLFAIGLAQRLGSRGLYAFSLHPGMVNGTNLIQGTYAPPEQFLADLQRTEEEYGTIFSGSSQADAEGESKNDDNAVQTHLLTAFSPDLERQELNGQHFLDAHLVDPYTGENPAWARDQIDADRLWTLSEKLVGEKFSYKE